MCDAGTLRSPRMREIPLTGPKPRASGLGRLGLEDRGRRRTRGSTLFGSIDGTAGGPRGQDARQTPSENPSQAGRSPRPRSPRSPKSYDGRGHRRRTWRRASKVCCGHSTAAHERMSPWSGARAPPGGPIEIPFARPPAPRKLPRASRGLPDRCRHRLNEHIHTCLRGHSC